MAEYIKREELNKWLDDLEVTFQSVEPLKPMEKKVISGLLKCTLSKHFVDLPSIDIDKYIPIKYVQDFCKDCADEGIGSISTYMEDAGEAIVKSWLAVKDTDFGKKYKR